MAGEPDHDLTVLCAHWSQMDAVQREWRILQILHQPFDKNTDPLL
jgi:hypothetical protein